LIYLIKKVDELHRGNKEEGGNIEIREKEITYDAELVKDTLSEAFEYISKKVFGIQEHKVDPLCKPNLISDKGSWYCSGCLAQNEQSKDQCEDCGKLRPLVSFEFSNENRKAVERQLVTSREDSLQNQKEFYAVSAAWIKRWKESLTKQSVDPGPIDNTSLMLDEGQQLYKLKEGLQRNKEYKMVNAQVWEVFYFIYGGGPIIKRP